MKANKYIAFLIIIVLFGVVLYINSHPKKMEVPPKYLILSKYEGFVVGYVNDSFRIDVYIISNGRLNGVISASVNNLPDCISFVDYSLAPTLYFQDDSLHELTLSLYLKPNRAGKCLINNSTLSLKINNRTFVAPLGRIEVIAYEKKCKPQLAITKYISGSIGPKDAPIYLNYTLNNQLNVPVEISKVILNLPGIKIVDTNVPLKIDPNSSSTLYIDTVNTTKMNNLYIIQPGIEIIQNTNTCIIPLEPFYYATIPPKDELVKMLSQQ